MATITRRNFSVTLPEPTHLDTGVSKAIFRYGLDQRIYKQELRHMLKTSGIKVVPPFIMVKIESVVNIIERALLQKIGELLGRVISTGGYGFSLDKLGKQVLIRPTGRPAGLRTFNIRSGQLSHAYSFKLSKQRLIAQWGPAVTSPRIPPKTYPSPTEPSTPLKHSPLNYYSWRRRVAPGVDKIAAIEAGDPAFQRPSPLVFIGRFSGVHTKYGMHPFEGAIQSNLDDLDIIYRILIRDILYKKAFITQGGRRLRLPTFVKQVTAQQIMSFVDKDLDRNRRKRLPFHEHSRTYRGNSKLIRLYKTFSSLVRKDSRFIKYADADILNKISDKYDKGTQVVRDVKVSFDSKVENKIESYLNRMLIDMDID